MHRVRGPFFVGWGSRGGSSQRGRGAQETAPNRSKRAGALPYTCCYTAMGMQRQPQTACAPGRSTIVSLPHITRVNTKEQQDA
eukprot:14078475-Alexandrium_andersonii.AAC.1